MKLLGLVRSWKSSTVIRSSRVLESKDRKKIVAVIILQVLMSFLDLVGVAAIGILGALAVTGVGSGNKGDRLAQILQVLGLANQSLQAQVAFLGIFASLVLTVRTILTIFFTRKLLIFLSRQSAEISTKLIGQLLSRNLILNQSRSTQEFIFALTYGVDTITLGIIGTIVTLIADSALLMIMLSGMIVVDLVLALSSIAFFSLVGFIVFRLLHTKAKNYGSQEWQLNVLSNQKIEEVLRSYRESIVRNSRDYYVSEVGKIRQSLARIDAEIAFLPYVSKYVMEFSVVLGALLISSYQFLTQTAVHAVSILAIFLAAGSRIAPAILRIQNSAITIKGSLGAAEPTLSLIDELAQIPFSHNYSDADSLDLVHKDFIGRVKVSNLSFKYPERENHAIKDVNIEISHGEFVAIVGSSGAGKTTFVDCLLGVLEPTRGTVNISGLTPIEAVKRWPGAVGYVPQDIAIINGTIRENVAMGFPVSLATDDLVLDAIEMADLTHFVEGLDEGLDTQVGDRGTKLSGGQRQRLGIARALFTKPSLLVLDEATSALDGETEANITNVLLNLAKKVTVVVVAHRLSTVKEADAVLYFEDGQIACNGTFSEVRNLVPKFDKQAKLLEL
jgi:ABC-type multidrug transport system fused ATPase/permease subunit